MVIVQCSKTPPPTVNPPGIAHMFKIDQFAAANEAAVNQFTQFAQLTLANTEKLAQLALGAAREKRQWRAPAKPRPRCG